MAEIVEVMEDFETLNKRVKAGLSTYVEVGLALLQISERKLYKEAGYKSFADYTEAEHGFGRRQGYRMIQAAKVEPLAPGISQHAAETLARIPEGDRAEVLGRATDRQGATPTAEMLSDMHAELNSEREPEPEPIEDQGLVSEAIKQRFREAYSTVQRARALVQQLGDEKQGRLLDVDACVVHLNNTLEEIRFAVPKHRCVYCGGDGCQHCKHSGMLSDRLYELAAEELKPE